MKEEKEDNNSSALIRICCCFDKKEEIEKLNKTIGKKLVKILFADMRGGIGKRSSLQQKIYTMYDKKLHLKSIKIIENKNNYKFNVFKFEFYDKIDNQQYFINLDFLDVLYFQTDVDEIQIKK